MTVLEAIEWLIGRDLDDFSRIVHQKEHADHIWHMVERQRDTIRSLLEDEQRTARVLDGMCEKIDELTKKPGTGKSILRALYYSDEGPHTDIPDWVKKGGK